MLGSQKPKHNHMPHYEGDPARKSRAAFTIKEFCAAHRISVAMFYKMRAAGLGPREMRVGRKVVVSIEAAADWRRAREQAA